MSKTALTKDILDIIADYCEYDFKRLKCLNDDKYQNNFIIKHYEFLQFQNLVRDPTEIETQDTLSKSAINVVFGGDKKKYYKYEEFIII